MASKKKVNKKLAGKKGKSKGKTRTPVKDNKGASGKPKLTKPPKEKKERGPTFGGECLKLLVEGGRTDEKIRAELEKKFPKHNGVKGTTHIKWYRSRLNAGAFKEKGFKRPDKAIKAIRELKAKPPKKEKVLSRKGKK